MLLDKMIEALEAYKINDDEPMMLWDDSKIVGHCYYYIIIALTFLSDIVKRIRTVSVNQLYVTSLDPELL